MPGLESIPSHSKSIVTTKTGHEYVLVPVSNNIADMNSMYTLNETGAFIWEHIDGKRCIAEIIDKLAEEYEVDRETAAVDVVSFMEEMGKYLVICDTSDH